MLCNRHRKAAHLTCTGALFFFLRIGDAADDIAVLVHDDRVLQSADQIAAEQLPVLIAEHLTLCDLGLVQPDSLGLVCQLVDAVKQPLIHADHILSYFHTPIITQIRAVCKSARQFNGECHMIALVTGASRGIGAAAAKRLAADGYTVIVHCNRNTEQAQAVADETGGIVMQADLADFAQIDKMVDAVIRQFGRIDVLVNNAGIALTGLFQDISDEDAVRLFQVDVGGTMHTAKRVMPYMLRAHQGSIVNVASVWGETGAACEVHYSAAKAAVIGFTKALAKETGLSGVRVNCVSPGVIDTDMNRMHSEEIMQELAEETALGRIGTPEDVAEAIAFLASEKSGFITGQIIPVNGGFHI